MCSATSPFFMSSAGSMDLPARVHVPTKEVPRFAIAYITGTDEKCLSTIVCKQIQMQQSPSAHYLTLILLFTVRFSSR